MASKGSAPPPVESMEEKKLKGLINSQLAQQLYCAQSYAQESGRLDEELRRFNGGTARLRKKLRAVGKRGGKAEEQLAAQELRGKHLDADIAEGELLNVCLAPR